MRCALAVFYGIKAERGNHYYLRDATSMTFSAWSLRHLIARFLALVVLLAATTAVAQPGPQQALDQALTAIEVGFDGPPGSGGRFPDRNDPAVAQQLDAVRTAMDAFGTPAFPVSDISMIDGVCGRLNAAMQSYLLFDLTAILARKEKTVAEVVANNAVRFEREFFVFMPAVVKCNAQMMPVLEAFWTNLPAADRTQIRVQGIQKARVGMEQSLLGLAMVSGEPQYIAANQALAIKMVATAAPAFSRVLPLSNRQSLLAAIKGIAGISQRFPAELTAIEQALSNRECTALCAVNDMAKLLIPVPQ
jgi:hypothetical protein